MMHRWYGYTKWYRLLAAVPGVGVSLLLGATCSVCWLTYAGLLSATMAGLLLDTVALWPVTALLLGLALVSLSYRARLRRGYGPLALGVVAVSSILAGQYWPVLDFLLFPGLALLGGASLWNAWPQRTASGEACPACVPAAAESTSLHIEESRR